MSSEEEKEIILNCLKNDRSSQEKLYRAHADKMYNVCLYYADDRHEARDFLQEGFLTVFRKLDQYKFDGSFEGWVRKVIVTTALGQLRKKKRYNEVVEDYRLSEIENDFEIEDLDTIPVKKVITMVNDLPGKCSIVLKLFAIEGYTHPEIAEIMGISIGTSKSQLNRARLLLKKSFKK